MVWSPFQEKRAPHKKTPTWVLRKKSLAGFSYHILGSMLNLGRVSHQWKRTTKLSNSSRLAGSWWFSRADTPKLTREAFSYPGNKKKSSLRNQTCPKKGIHLIILFWGWDWDHQSYSREGSGFLGPCVWKLLGMQYCNNVKQHKSCLPDSLTKLFTYP